MKRFLRIQFVVPALGSLGILAALLIGPQGLRNFGPHAFDAAQYYDIASGGSPEVIPPFAYRVLHPALAALISKFTGLGIGGGFYVLSIISLALLSIAVVWYLRNIPSSVGLLLIFQPILYVVFRDAYLHDGLYLALTVILFLAAVANSRSALLLAFVLPFIRETAVLTSFTGATLGIGSRWLAICTAVAGAVAFVLWKADIAVGPMNAHGMNDFLYSVAKFPVNLFENVTGLRFWHNVIPVAKCPMFIDVHLPEIAALGRINEVGLCDPSLAALGYFWVPVLGALGMLPLLIFVRRKAVAIAVRGKWDCIPLIIYAVLMFVFAVAGGKSTDRLLIHVWPALLFLVPKIDALQDGIVSVREAHLAAAGIALVFLVLSDAGPFAAWLTLPAIAALTVLNYSAWKKLNRG